MHHYAIKYMRGKDLDNVESVTQHYVKTLIVSRGSHIVM